MKPVLSLCLALTGAPAAAQQIDVRLSVLPGYVTPAGTRMAALKLALPEGWKTYWRAPGDAGIPPLITLDGVPGARLHWPTPQVFDQNGMRSVGYHDGLVLPVELPPGTTHLSGQMDIGVCRDVCVPVTLSFDAGLGAPGATDPAILAAVLDHPQRDGSALCRVTPTDDGLNLTAELDVDPTGGAEALVIETADPSVWVSEPRIARSGDVVRAQARLVRGDGAAFALDRSAVRFTLLGSDRAIEIVGCSAG